MDLSLQELAERIGARLEGDGGIRVRGVATLTGAGPGDVSFLTSPAYRGHLGETRASAVILGEEDLPACPTHALVMANPYAGYAHAASALNPPEAPPVGRHPGAHVEPSASIGDGVWIGPGAVVEAGARIGAGCFIGPACVVARGAELGPGGHLVASVYIGESVRVGARCLMHPGAVIGADGFGFAQEDGRWVKIPQLGSVVLGDDVEIGANTAVDRGALDDTLIGDGVKLDNHVQIGHNVRIGEHTAIAGMSGVAGSAVIGKRCGIGGGVGVNGHVELADGVYLTVHTTVYHSIPEPGVYSSGVMEQDNRSWRRNTLRFRQLDDMMKRIRTLEKKVEGGG